MRVPIWPPLPAASCSRPNAPKNQASFKRFVDGERSMPAGAVIRPHERQMERRAATLRSRRQMHGAANEALLAR